MTNESPHESLVTVHGRAHTAAANGSADPADLQPARALRRALANGGLNAREVGLVAVWATGPRARERAEHAVERGLGRFASGVGRIYDNPRVEAACAAAIARGEVSVAVALTIDPAKGNLALAFTRPR